MKFITKIIILAILLIVIVSYFVNSYFIPEDKLETFCLQALDYSNTNNLPPEEYKAFSLSNLVRDNINYKYTNSKIITTLNVSQVLETMEGECADHSLLFYECCNYLNLTCGINYYNSQEKKALHYWNFVIINNKTREIDPSLSEKKDYYLFVRGVLTSNYWDKRSLGLLE